MKKVVKFGGSSLASASQIKKVAEIIRGDESRRFVVPSAPGKRYSDDIKVTDLLYRCYDAAAAGADIEGPMQLIKNRYQEIIDGLGLDLSLEGEFEVIHDYFLRQAGRDYAASRGEYLNGIIIAAYLGYKFIDAAEVILFDEKGNFDGENTNEVMRQRLKNMENAVIPGFYGAMPDGSIKTFSRGGSDITGSIVARAVRADVYENWTDVSGMLVTDPHVVDNPEPIETITYRELRELAYMGATVMHEDAIFPVRQEGIPINIRNKMMNSEIGFGRRVLQVFEENGISFEHTPSGIDTFTVLVHQSEFVEKEQTVIAGLHRAVNPDSVDLESNLALIAVVGRGMKAAKGTAGRVFSALAHANVNIKMIDQGSSELNIIIGVRDEDFDAAIKAIYDIFVTIQL